MDPLKINYVPIGQLLPYAGNPRQHSPAQIAQLVKSIEKFGFIMPILIDAEARVVAGHGRLLAAKKLSLANVPVICVVHLSETEITAYRIADNKLAENGTWDKHLLGIELNALLRMESTFDVDVIGFSTPELDILTDALRPADHDFIDEVVEVTDPVTVPGDVWRLDSHRVFCGDVRAAGAIAQLVENELAGMVITDPPYNVPIAGHVSGLGRQRHEEFAMASGEMSTPEFTAFLRDAVGAQAASCREGALIYTFMDWRHLNELTAATYTLGLTPINLCVWVKTNAGMGSLYRSQHELVSVTRKGVTPHINNVQLGSYGRHRTNVWTYPGMNTFSAGRNEALAAHPTVKPVAMIRDAIFDASVVGDIVLDGFLGSGTTLIAAEQSRRRCYGIEISPQYIDTAILRWSELTGGMAVHARTGQTFREVAASRRDGHRE